MNEHFYYHIYAHDDTDGGVSAAIFLKFLKNKYPQLKVNVHPVSHSNDPSLDWSQMPLEAPCAILDFGFHTQLMSQKFYHRIPENHPFPQCFWLDHHPTGLEIQIDIDSLEKQFPLLKIIWDTQAISTPGLFRKHHEIIGFPLSLLKEYQYYSDLAEIVDGALYANAQNALDTSHPATQLATLFSTQHPLIDKVQLYKRLVKLMSLDAHFENLIGSDPLFPGILEFSHLQKIKQEQSYQKHCKIEDNVIIADFSKVKHFSGWNRFLPFALFPHIQYGIHILPEQNNIHVITCGINPWNKPQNTSLNIGEYFAKHFMGGGHSFVAGGKCTSENLKLIHKLVQFLNH